MAHLIDMANNIMKWVCVWSLLAMAALAIRHGKADECNITPVIHVLRYPGCVPKPIPSFACQGKCTSYVEVSASKIWQLERSCMCCQEAGEREAIVTLWCPNAPEEQRYRRVKTRAPVECMCRPCVFNSEDRNSIPHEIAHFGDNPPVMGLTTSY